MRYELTAVNARGVKSYESDHKTLQAAMLDAKLALRRGPWIDRVYIDQLDQNDTSFLHLEITDQNTEVAL